MSPWEVIRSASRALRSNKLRTVLSVLGIVIGVGSVIALVSVGTGAQRQVTESISSLGTELININPAFSRGFGSRISQSRNMFTLSLAEEIKAASPSVSHVVPLQQTSGLLVYDGANLQATVVGVTPEYQDVMNYWPLIGRFVRERDLEARDAVAVLGSDVATTLFGPTLPIGERLILSVGDRRIPLTVVGVMEPKGQVFLSNFDDQVYVPITTLLNRVMGTQTVSSFVATAHTADLAQDAVQQIEYFLMQRLGGTSAFRVSSQQALLETLTSTLSTFTVMLAAISGISLLVGGIGIMNIMLVSVTERTREIGIRKALGALRRDLLMQFLTEAVALSLIGGVLGVGVGWACSLAVERFGDMPTSVSLSAVLLALGFSITVGLVFGVYPASRASRLDPVVALRHD